jgi:hypothetical protein
MIHRRASRILVALAAIACVLFTQLAVAAHGCGDSNAIPALCQAHCDQDSRSLDRPGVPVIAPAAATGLRAAPFVPVPLVSTPPVASQLLARTTAPPLAITLCCFRI